jgi:putative SOS response-associated peptidase YedK
MKDDSPFVFAGLWEGWQNPETQEWLRTCTIIKAWNPSGVIFHSRTGWMSSPTIWRSAATKPHP